MKPLREQLDDPDTAVRAGAMLLAKIPPLELSAAQRRRIRARLDAAPESRGLRWLKPAFALPVLLIVGVAGASLGQRWLRTVAPQQVLAQDPKHAVAPSAQLRAPRTSDVNPAEPAAAVTPPEAEAEPKPAAVPAARPGASGPGASLMMEALQARRAGDTARAQQLAAEYQKKYPNGALREEALAIGFEAAAARSDPSAARLAQRYLASFPHGRFRKQAEQVLAN